MNQLSLFTGSGIGDWAAAQVGIETIAQCENDPVCQFALRKLWPETYLFKDARDVSAESLRVRGLWPIDIISGGFPCQDLSTAGRGAGIEGSRSGLWREMFRVIRQVRPTWLVIENVPVIRVRGVDRVLAPLERIGYTCWPLVVGAWAVGAPHKRDRVWIVAHRVANSKNNGSNGDRDQPPPQLGKRDGQSNAHVTGSSKELADANRNGEAVGDISRTLRDTIGHGSGHATGRQEQQYGADGASGFPYPTSLGCERRKGNAARGIRDGGDAGRVQGDDLSTGFDPKAMGDTESGGTPTDEQRGRLRSPLGTGQDLADANRSRREYGRSEFAESTWPASGMPNRECSQTGGYGPLADAGYGNDRIDGCHEPNGRPIPHRPARPGEPGTVVGDHGLAGPSAGDGALRRVRPDPREHRPGVLDTAVPDLQVHSVRDGDVSLPRPWPARPGEPQHPGEAPRLVEFGVGSEFVGLARRILDAIGGGGNGVPPDRVASRANKSLLRIIGNGWQYDIPLLIYRWIASEDSHD